MKKFILIYALSFLTFGCSSTDSKESSLDSVAKPQHASKAYDTVRPYSPGWRYKSGIAPVTSESKTVIRFQEKESGKWSRKGPLSTEEKAMKNMNEKNLLERPFIEAWPDPKLVKKRKRSWEEKEEREKKINEFKRKWKRVFERLEKRAKRLKAKEV